MVKLSQFSRGELEILKSMNLQCQLGARYCYASVFFFFFKVHPTNVSAN